MTHRIDSSQELPTQALPIVRLTACENWEAKTREQLLLFPSCCPWCGGNLGFTDRRTSAQRSGQRGKRTVLPRRGRKPMKTRLHGQDFPGSSGKTPFSFTPSTALFFSARRKEKGGGIRPFARAGARNLPRRVGTPQQAATAIWPPSPGSTGRPVSRNGGFSAADGHSGPRPEACTDGCLSGHSAA